MIRARILDQAVKTNQKKLTPEQYTKTNPKWIIDLNVKLQITRRKH